MNKSKVLRHSVTIIVMLIIAPVFSISAQTSVQTPEAVAAQYIEATRANDWAKCAQFLHPDALAKMKRMFAPLVVADKTKNFSVDFFAVHNIAEYEKLPDAVVYERLMTNLVKRVPAYKEAAATSEMKILGHVKEGTDIVHVVYRMNMKINGAPVSKMAVMSLKSDGKTWRALLTGDFEAMFTGLSA